MFQEELPALFSVLIFSTGFLFWYFLFYRLCPIKGQSERRMNLSAEPKTNEWVPLAVPT